MASTRGFLAIRAIFSAATLCFSAALAPQPLAQIDLEVERAAIGQFQDIDQRLQDVGWRLVSGNARFCDRVTPSIGLQLQDIASYGRPDVAKAALGLDGAFAVQTAAAGSPSALSGAFRRNREIARIAGEDPNAWSADKRMDWKRLARAHDWIDETLAQDSAVTFAFINGETTQLYAVKACTARFQLISKSNDVRSNGPRVMIGAENKAFAFPEAEFAAMAAHELAHTLLDHTAWRDRNGRNYANIRVTEREADRLMPWLLANAGYDPSAAVRFFRKFRPRSGSVLFIKGTHYKWRERAALVEAELPMIARLMTREGEADWRTHFRRDIDPAQGLTIAEAQ